MRANIVAARLADRTRRPDLPRLSSNSATRRQNLASKSRHRAGGFRFDGSRTGTVVGIQLRAWDVEVKWRLVERGQKPWRVGCQPTPRVAARWARSPIRMTDGAARQVSQAAATGGRVLRTDDVLHRPSESRFPGIPRRRRGILQAHRRTGPRPSGFRNAKQTRAVG